MLNTTEGLTPKDIIDMVIRRRWFIIIPFCFSMIVGIFLTLTLPKMYQAETLILIQPQRVPTDYVKSVVSTDIDSRVNTIAQQILSRTNLEKIIEDFDLFSDPKYNDMFMEDKIESLRERISVDITTKSRRRDSDMDAFSISYEGQNPEKVMGIANALTTYIIDENLRVREIQAIGTSDFLDEELTSIRKELELQEDKLKKYREAFMGGLPEQLESNLRVLDRLQEQMTAKQESLRDAKARQALLENQISQRQTLVTGSVDKILNGNAMTDSKDVLSLDQARAQLAFLETKYTEKHPDIVRLKNIIADLEGNGEGSDDETSGKPTSAAAKGSRNRSALVSQINEVKLEINTIVADINQIIEQIRIYQKRVEDTPKREQEFLSIQRDYNNIKETYNSLLNRQLEAEIAVNMEKKQKGEQFRILDPARLPEKPISPDMKKLFLIVLAAGLGIGGGLVFVLEHFDTSFRRPEDIETLLGVPVLSTIPIIYDQKAKRKQKAYQFLSLFLIMLSFVLLAGFAVLTFNGVDQTLALVSRLII